MLVDEQRLNRQADPAAAVPEHARGDRDAALDDPHLGLQRDPFVDGVALDVERQVGVDEAVTTPVELARDPVAEVPAPRRSARSRAPARRRRSAPAAGTRRSTGPGCRTGPARTGCSIAVGGEHRLRPQPSRWRRPSSGPGNGGGSSGPTANAAGRANSAARPHHLDPGAVADGRVEQRHAPARPDQLGRHRHRPDHHRAHELVGDPRPAAAPVRGPPRRARAPTSAAGAPPCSAPGYHGPESDLGRHVALAITYKNRRLGHRSDKLAASRLDRL